MAEIIKLDDKRAARRRKVATGAGPARILFFLGVRYERHVGDEAGPSPQSLPGNGKQPPRRRRRRAS